MNCNYCGKALPDDSEFCAYCGKAVEKDLTPRCRVCGRQVTEDSLFCPYCGTTLSKPEKEGSLQSVSTTTSVQTKVKPSAEQSERRTKKSKRPLIFAAIALIVLVALLFSQPVDSPKTSTSSSNNTSQSTLPSVSEPYSGKLLECNVSTRESSITVHADSGSSCVVKIKNSSGFTILSFYVRAGESATVDVPAALLRVYFASGETWYGEKLLFGKETQYSMDDDLLDFSEYTYEYTLYPITNGNFSQTPIDANDF